MFSFLVIIGDPYILKTDKNWSKIIDICREKGNFWGLERDEQYFTERSLNEEQENQLPEIRDVPVRITDKRKEEEEKIQQEKIEEQISTNTISANNSNFIDMIPSKPELLTQNNKINSISNLRHNSTSYSPSKSFISLFSTQPSLNQRLPVNQSLSSPEAIYYFRGHPLILGKGKKFVFFKICLFSFTKVMQNLCLLLLFFWALEKHSSKSKLTLKLLTYFKSTTKKLVVTKLLVS
jgi:hypothetical protein